MEALFLSKDESREIAEKKIIVPSRIGTKVIHSHHGKYVLFILPLALIVKFLTFPVSAITLAIIPVFLILVGINDARTVSKIKEASGRDDAIPGNAWTEHDLEFWGRAAEKRGISLNETLSTDAEETELH